VIDALKYHSENFPGNGKIEVISKVVIRDFYELSLAYTEWVEKHTRILREFYSTYIVPINMKREVV